MRHLKKALQIIHRGGWQALIRAALKKLGLPLKPEDSGYKTYQFEFTPIDKQALLDFLDSQQIQTSDLIVVPECYRSEIKKKYKGHVICTLESNSINDPDIFTRLIWASERVERGMKIARTFYKSKKTVIVMKHTGPARVWMHDDIKENVLRQEYNIQNIEGIAKFGHGIGADFGNLLQLIDYSRDLKGDFVEIGCFKGSSTCVMASYMRANGINKRLVVYDYFDGFTYKEAKISVDSIWVGTHKTDGRDAVEKRVKKRLGEFNDNLLVIKRNIINKNALAEVKKIALANIDVDLYEAVYAALYHVHEKIIQMGIIVVEDAGHTPALLGAKLALDEFLDDVGPKEYIKIQMESGQYILIKK